MKERERYQVASDCVRIWRGYKLSTLGLKKYYKKLGEILIPATPQFQATLGLTAYLPSLLPPETPNVVPDEIALVFYKTQQIYKETFQTTGGRAYGLLHSAIFDFTKGKSTSDFPVLLQNVLNMEQPYYLFNRKNNWQQGITKVFVGIRKKGTSLERFQNNLLKWLNNLQTANCNTPNNAYVVASEYYVIYWENWGNDIAASLSRIKELANISAEVYQKTAVNLLVTKSWDEKYAGIQIKGGEFLNLQFKLSGQ